MVIDDFLKSSNVNYKKIKNKEDSFFYFEHQDIPDLRVLMTSGLSQLKMDVHEKHVGEEFAELYFLLPVYWQEEDLYKEENEWVFTCLSKIKNHIETNNAWVGHGHTFSFENAEGLNSPISTHFMITNQLVKELLKPIQSEKHAIQFLALPIYKNELSFKEARGTFKLEEKLQQYQVTEKMDGYRESVIKSRFARLLRNENTLQSTFGPILCECIVWCGTYNC